MTIEEILKEWEVDSKINENDIESSTISIARIHAKYLSMYAATRTKLRLLRAKHEARKHLIWRYYTGKMIRSEMDDHGLDYDPFCGGAKPMKSDMNRYVDVHEKVSSISAEIERCTIISETLSEILDTIKWRGQHIKNIIEIRKFQAGD